jgi:uncharacterized protein YerC
MDKEFAEFIEKEELNIEAAFVEEFGLDERKMTDAEKEEREEIVKKLKPKLQSFKDRYGADAEKVMYATATKQAMEEFKLGEGWKKGKYKVTDGKTGKVLGTFNSGGKAQKFVDDLFQKGDYESLTVELDEEVELEKEASSYFKKKKGKGEKSFGISRKKGNIRHGEGGYREEVEIEEKKSSSGYELYHKTFSAAMQHAYDHAKSKGHVIDPKEIDDKVATGPKKPSSGKTNRYSLKAGRKKVEIQVANLDNKRYELNMYIEEVELEEMGNVAPTAPDSGGIQYQAPVLGQKKKKKKQMVDESLQRTTFAGKDVFIVDSETFYNCRLGKKKYGRYEKYVGNGKVGQTIREYGLKYPRRPIILQNGESGPMLYLKYGRS